MPEFDGSEWRHAKGEVVIEVTPRHMVDISVSCTKPVQVLGVPGTSGVSAVVLRTGSEFRFRGPVKNFAKIVIRGTGETPFGLRVIHSPRQNGEPLSDEKPPVIDLGEPSNLVAKMRRMAADAHRFRRMPVLEPEDGPSLNRYEVDDDAELLFEEEWLEQRQQELEEAKKAKARKDAEDDGTAHDDEASPPKERLKAPPEPPKSKDKGGDPPEAKAAE